MTARERHLDDQMMQHDVVQHDDSGIRHRRAVRELVVRIVAELVNEVLRAESRVLSAILDHFELDVFGQFRR
jgi:hypothetical protein